MARITIISPEGQHEFDLVQGHNTLGRHPNNTVQILDRIVSKEHCHIDLVDGRFILRDAGSLNGTFVNGDRVQQHVLSDRDEISLGSTKVIFWSGETTLPLASQPGGQSRVTMTPGTVASHIRTKLAPLIDQKFLPEQLIQDPEALRQDYEKLRVSYELARTIGVELDVDRLLVKILDWAFEIFSADRGIVLLFDEQRELKPRCVRRRRGDSGEEVLLSNTILNEVLRDRAALLSNDTSIDSRFQGAHSIIMQGIRSSMAVPLLYSSELLGVMVLDSQIATNAFSEKDLQLFQNVATQAAIAIQNSLFAKKIEEEALTRQRFQRLLSPAIAEQVISGKVEVAKGGELRDASVLFSDIRGFTAMSESRKAQDIVDMLNEYFELMVEVIFKYEGTLDKFVGDEIMALFGAPVGHLDHAYRAVKTGLEMIQVLNEFNRMRISEGQEPIHIGIGINTGDMVAGYLGSSKALEYTVIGDTVNTGARLCSVAKAGEIIISEYTYERVKNEFEVVELPPAEVKGKSRALKIYRVLGERRRRTFGNDGTNPSLPSNTV